MSETPADPLPKTYAYSFDRESFVGDFPDRAAALEAAKSDLIDSVRAGRTGATNSTTDSPTEAIYVARRVPAVLHARGHAKVVAAALRDAFAETTARDGSRLRRPTEEDLAALDEKLADAVATWLRDRDLVQQEQTVEAIAEHPVDLKPHVEPTEDLEIGPLGET